MSDFERTETYIESLDIGNTEFLDELENEALRTSVPIIRKGTQRFLKLVLSIKKPKTILEVGTAIGFSSILMAHYSEDDCKITTIEKYEKRFDIAEENFKKSGFPERINFLKGDASDILHELSLSGEKFDLIFMDAAKGQYINFLPDILTLLESGSILISDNVLQDNTVIQSKFTIPRRDRTIHKRIREYLFELTHNDNLVTDILQIGDGICISVKK